MQAIFDAMLCQERCGQKYAKQQRSGVHLITSDLYFYPQSPKQNSAPCLRLRGAANKNGLSVRTEQPAGEPSERETLPI